LQGSRQIVSRVGVILFEADGFLKLSDGCVNLILLRKTDTKIVVSLGIIRLRADGGLKLTDGVGNPSLVEEGDAQIVVSQPAGGILINGCLPESFGGLLIQKRPLLAFVQGYLSSKNPINIDDFSFELCSHWVYLSGKKAM
jgi:hypothetical protein